MTQRNHQTSLKCPNEEKNILLHCCCAPCSGGMITLLLNSGIMPTVFFYNPNIHPEAEYLLRKCTLTDFLKKNCISFIDADYDPETWFEKTRGLEQSPQRGPRCDACFEMRLTRGARTAKELGLRVFTSSFGISRWKDKDQVDRAGLRAAEMYGVTYWDYNWRKGGGQDLMRQIARQEHFYTQTYCGCRYSLDIQTCKKSTISSIDSGQMLY